MLKTTLTIFTNKESLAKLTAGIKVPVSEYAREGFLVCTCLPTSPASVLIPRVLASSDQFLLFFPPGTPFPPFLTWFMLNHHSGPRLEPPPPGSFPRLSKMLPPSSHTALPHLTHLLGTPPESHMPPYWPTHRFYTSASKSPKLSHLTWSPSVLIHTNTCIHSLPCICMAESPHCSPETTTTLLIGYTPIQNKKFKVWN